MQKKILLVLLVLALYGTFSNVCLGASKVSNEQDPGFSPLSNMMLKESREKNKYGLTKEEIRKAAAREVEIKRQRDKAEKERKITETIMYAVAAGAIAFTAFKVRKRIMSLFSKIMSLFSTKKSICQVYLFFILLNSLKM